MNKLKEPDLSSNPSFDAIKLKIVSPQEIESWSYGEVSKSETINYRTLRPEPDGLFCEKIFGPTRDYECHCGKYKGMRYKGVICEKCGVEITSSKVRRERMGHIKLFSTVVHSWYLKSIPSKLGILLELSPMILERVIYYGTYLVIKPGSSPLKAGQALEEEAYKEYLKQYPDLVVGMGGEAIRDVLRNIDLDETILELRKEYSATKGQRRSRIVRKLELLEAFKIAGNRPEWMVLDILPVIPPDLRPLIHLDSGRFASSDLNDLYRRVINRNNRLKKLIEVGAPDIIIRNEKRMLQEAVDALIDNSKRVRPIMGSHNKPLRSLSEILRGKQGRFRQNLLGKRVDYSGRSVIVVGPELKLHQCGLPKEMALELFKPFVIHELILGEHASNEKGAKRLIDRRDEKVWSVLEDVCKEQLVLLNRAPTLHRASIQAFEPILGEGKAIRIHPMVCPPFNADFDGDQMAVHVPLSPQAQSEARLLMLSNYNLLSPANGRPLVSPTQDIVLGCYYMTLETERDSQDEEKVYASPEEAVYAYEIDLIGLHERIKILLNGNQIITTPGRLIFNLAVNEALGTKMGVNFPYLNSVYDKKALQNVIYDSYETFGPTKTAVLLDALKMLGFKYSTMGGATISISDMKVPPEKEGLLKEGEEEVKFLEKEYRYGRLSSEERYRKVVKTWDETRRKIAEAVVRNFHDFDNLYMMFTSGARGNRDQVSQLVGVRGLMTDPTGRTIEFPIKSSFLDGLKVLEYFISTHGGRKGLADTALKTADAGYLTRRLVDVAHEAVISEIDCAVTKVRALKKGDRLVLPLSARLLSKEALEEVKDPKTGEILVKVGEIITLQQAQKIEEAGIKEVLVRQTVDSLEVSEIVDGRNVIETLEERIWGRVVAEDVVHPITAEILVRVGEPITRKKSHEIGEADVKSVKIRSILTCKSVNGVCSTCYGLSPATQRLVEIGEAVGVIAAQSIGEPGTQLTMRTFHTGGVAAEDITRGLPRVEELFEARRPKKEAVVSEGAGKARIVQEEGKRKIVVSTDDGQKYEYDVSFGQEIEIWDGDEVKEGQRLTEGGINPHKVLEVYGLDDVRYYFLREIQRVYKGQKVDISDVHLEVIIKQMLKKVIVDDPGSSKFFAGELVDRLQFEEIGNHLEAQGLKRPQAKLALFGITKAALVTESFLSAASFQETTRVLTDAAIKGKVDDLRGLKENVILGRLMPAGTGHPSYKKFSVETSELDIIG